jgi:hypothetical protein
MNQDRDFKGIWIPKEIWLIEELKALEKIKHLTIKKYELSK